MNIQFDIPDNKVQNLSPNGRTELTTRSKELAEEIIDEAARIEASRRNPNTNIEITAAIINEAAFYAKRLPPRIKNGNRNKVIQIIAFISTLVSGSLLDSENLQSETMRYGLLAALAVAISTTVYLTFNNENNG